AAFWPDSDAGGRVEERGPVHHDPPPRPRTETGDGFQERRLPRPGRAHDGRDAAPELRIDTQGEAGERQLEPELDHVAVRRARRRVKTSAVQSVTNASRTVTPARTCARSSWPT